MDELINAMSNEDLIALKAKYPDNQSVTTLIDGILATRKVEAEAKAIEEAFRGKVAKLAKLPAPPTNIHNVYMAWKEVETPEGEPVEVDIPEANGVAAHKETRQPTTKAYQWVVEVNKGFQVGKTTTTTSDGKATTSKRAITVNKRNGQTLQFVGNFPSASKACDFLKLQTGGDSATRVLTREGYILDAYTGTDYTT